MRRWIQSEWAISGRLNVPSSIACDVRVGGDQLEAGFGDHVEEGAVLFRAKTEKSVCCHVEEDQLSIDFAPCQRVAIRVWRRHGTERHARREGARARSAQSSASPMA
jgi:hypothetical protein